MEKVEPTKQEGAVIDALARAIILIARSDSEFSDLIKNENEGADNKNL